MTAEQLYKKKTSLKRIIDELENRNDMFKGGVWLRPDDLTLISQAVALTRKQEEEFDALIELYNEPIAAQLHSDALKAQKHKPKKRKPDEPKEVRAKRGSHYQ